MLLTNETILQPGEPGNAITKAAGAEPSSSEIISTERPLEDVMRSRVSEALGTVMECADPPARLETALEDVAQELSRDMRLADGSEPGAEPSEEIGTAIATLVNVALEANDPVAALEEGVESLAEALTARDAAAEQWLQTALEQEVEFEGAYRHARLHRATELMDHGYSLDQAVAITNANEAEIQARALAAGRNPMEPIYQYAVLNGYQGVRNSGSAFVVGSTTSGAKKERQSAGPLAAMQALAGLSDDAFAEATRGDRWQRLMGR